MVPSESEASLLPPPPPPHPDTGIYWSLFGACLSILKDRRFFRDARSRLLSLSAWRGRALKGQLRGTCRSRTLISDVGGTPPSRTGAPRSPPPHTPSSKLELGRCAISLQRNAHSKSLSNLLSKIAPIGALNLQTLPRHVSCLFGIRARTPQVQIPAVPLTSSGTLGN